MTEYLLSHLMGSHSLIISLYEIQNIMSLLFAVCSQTLGRLYTSWKWRLEVMPKPQVNMETYFMVHYFDQDYFGIRVPFGKHSLCLSSMAESGFELRM